MIRSINHSLALLAAAAVACSTAVAAETGATNPWEIAAITPAKRLPATTAQFATPATQSASEIRLVAPAVHETAPADPDSVSQISWLPRNDSEVRFAESDASASDDESIANGWRKHRKAEEFDILFKGQKAAETTDTTATATPIAETSSAASNSSPTLLAPAKSELPAAPAATQPAAISAAASLAQSSQELQAATAGALADGEAASDTRVQLAARTFQEDGSLVPDSEPLPPAPGYGNGMVGGGEEPLPMGHGGEYCGCDACCRPRPVLFWTAGVEATFLNPDLNNNGAEFGVIEFDEGREDYFDTQTNDVDSFYLAPRIWLGVQGCKWGMNFRYFHLRANEGAFDPVFGSDGEWDGPGCGVPDFGYNSCNDLEAYTIDLEVTRRVCVHDCAMQFSLGVRHAQLQQDEVISGVALADDSVVFGFASAHRQSRGTGLVFGWYGRRPIFPCSCVHWFYNARFSPVWGPTQTLSNSGVDLTLTGAGVLADAGSVNEAATYVDDTMFIGEIQVGLEWLYGLRCIPANAFFRAAVEYQRWDGGQGFTAADSFAAAELNGDLTTFTSAAASADEPQMDLLGIVIGTGLTW